MRWFTELLGMKPLEGLSAVTFGTFDGVHIGHQAVIGRVVEEGHRCGLLSVVVSFDPHPLRFIAPDKAPSLLTLSAKKLELFEGLGVDVTVLAKLEPQLAEMSPQEFVERILVGKLGAQKVVVGPDCSFGKGRSGNVEVLKEMGGRFGFSVYVVPKKKINGAPISSTRVRNAIKAGDLRLAERMLGRRYSILGRVIKGERIGKKIGYPTANLDTDDQLLPPKGVYAARVKLDGKRFNGLLYIGERPTFEGREMRIEVHILDFNGDIYGRWLEVEFAEAIRGERRFASAEELAGQLAQDERIARRILER
ncbi:bifunctional riboflavin kinase/FAD synthetase [Candidatus Poribacteria bacterium]|nr:bifunctional riboflavin kinase/FAD synthetase [Candidatus Poribacteria bacterium]